MVRLQVLTIMEDSKILRTSTLVATNTANKLFSASIYNDRSSPEIFADKRNKGDGYTHGRINEIERPRGVNFIYSGGGDP